jgi:hypothetical protein
MTLSGLGCELGPPLTLSMACQPSWNHFGIRQLRRPVKRKERTLDLQKIVSELRAERDRINQAIEALDGKASPATTKRGAGAAPAPGRRRGGITPEGRRRLSEAMKKRWAERRKKRS